MKQLLLILLTLGFVTADTFSQEPKAGTPATVPEPSIDWAKAQGLLRRERSGEKLSPEDQTFLDRAKEVRRKGGQAGGGGGQRKPPASFTALTELGAEGRYEGQDGGLYGGGSNEPPAALAKVAETQLAKIQPLGPDGKPAADGKIVLVSLSMSNATQEFSTFKRAADAAPEKSPKVVVVDCAQGGQAMAEWAPPTAWTWTEALRRIESAGVTPLQVQAAWVKLANKAPSGSLELHGKKLEADTLALLQNAKAKFPNLRVAYLGSRTYGGYAVGNLNPEPYAYESAFPARWLIQRQMKGDPELMDAKAPLLLWGPYLWANGTSARKLDGLVWERSDFVADGVHPSTTGRNKVSSLLLNFFTKDPMAKSWFAK